MVKYKHVQTANGRDMYFKNGKMISKDKVPAGVINILEPGTEIEMPTPGDEQQTNVETVDQGAEPEAQLKEQNEAVCIFCGEPATRERFVNLKIAKLCDNDYGNNTTGEVVEQMRKVAEEI